MAILNYINTDKVSLSEYEKMAMTSMASPIKLDLPTDSKIV
jgi:hypothetical protein